MFKMLSKKWLNRVMVGAVHNQVYKIIFGVAYSRRSVSRGAVQKTAREKIKKSAARGSERTPVGKLNKRSFRYTRIWYTP